MGKYCLYSEEIVGLCFLVMGTPLSVELWILWYICVAEHFERD
jgi:hypothetical protein